MDFFVKIILTIILLNSFVLSAQRKSSDKELSKDKTEQLADEALQFGKFERALVLYKKLLENDKENSKLNFLIGYCYINTNYGKETSIQYLEKAVENIKPNNENNAPIEVYYYLSKAYHINHEFSKAVEVLDTSINKIPKHQPNFIEKAKKLKRYCNNVLIILKSDVDLEVKNIIDINSKFSEYNPVFNKINNEIIFTSRRAGNEQSIKNRDGQYDENIYISKIINNVWQKPQKIDKTLNTNNHEKVCFVSKDGSTMIIRKLDKHRGSLYISNKNDDNVWTNARLLNKNINTKYQETHGSISADGQLLFFVSDRKGAKGGTDIFVSKKTKEGIWGEAKNLGNKINSIFDEETPYLHENGTLFFASKGHNSIGGYDIYASTQDSNGIWSIPINMGLPINSVFDDFGYTPTKIGKQAYFASNRKGGKGESDIFEVVLNTNKKNDYLSVFGELKFENSKLIENTKIIVCENNSSDTLFLLTNIPLSGKYQFTIKAGEKYKILYTYNNTIIHKSIIDSKPGGSVLVLDQLVFIDDIAINSNTTNRLKTDYIISKPLSNKIIFTNLISFDDKNVNINKNEADTTKTDSAKNFYSIELTNSNRKQDILLFSDINGVKEYNNNQNNIFTYYYGEYEYDWEAKIELRRIKEKYPNAKIFINKFDNKNK